MRILVSLLIFAIIFSSCSPAKRLGLQKSFEKTDRDFKDHTGFVLFDPALNKTVYEYNSSKYFTPASNTKIFTLYTSLRILGDSIPALRYCETPDSLIFWGTGDPSFLYRYTYQNSRVYEFLKTATKPLYFSESNFYTTHFGRGWAWDDYSDYYSAERSPFPVFGNIMTLEKTGKQFKVSPSRFQSAFSIGPTQKVETVTRELNTNKVYYFPGLGRTKMPATWDVPIRMEEQLAALLLSDTLKRPVIKIVKKRPPATLILYSIPSDSLYRVMMKDSDNFIAEQLLLMCADVVRDSLKTEIAIQYSIKNFLGDLPDKPVWIDGSGLSRYNLFTPRSIVKLWQKISEEVPKERLFELLAVGGQSGTLKNWYKGSAPFIFGKTGSLSNNHSLSGFLVTKSGKTLIFAFMNNNFIVSQSDIRRNMQQILLNIHENY